jgi:hypothetical protein
MSAVSREATSYWYSVLTPFGSVSSVRRPASSYWSPTAGVPWRIWVRREAAS